MDRKCCEPCAQCQWEREELEAEVKRLRAPDFAEAERQRRVVIDWFADVQDETPLALERADELLRRLRTPHDHPTKKGTEHG